MKKLFLSFLITIVATSAYAQATEEEPTFWFGPKVGVDLATPTINENQIRSEVKSNYQYGFFLQFGRKFYVQPELYYATQKEAASNSSNLNEVNSLRLPLMFGMRLFNAKIFSAHIMAGPTTSYILNEKLNSSTSTTTTNRDKLNFALQGGAGVDVIGLFTLDVRYSVDLTDNIKQQFQTLSINNGVNVTLGIKLR